MLKFDGADVTLKVFPDGLRKRDEKKDGLAVVDYDWLTVMEEWGSLGTGGGGGVSFPFLLWRT